MAHGNSSGIDPAVVVYGGLIAFTKGKPIERLKINRPIKLLLVNSGRPTESTKEMIELVARNPDKDMLIEKIGELTQKAKAKLEMGEDVAELLNENGLLLEQLGVVGKKARELSEVLRTIGAKVKISGAGGVASGSGMMMVVHPDLTQIKKLLDNKQISYFETEIR